QRSIDHLITIHLLVPASCVAKKHQSPRRGRPPPAAPSTESRGPTRWRPRSAAACSCSRVYDAAPWSFYDFRKRPGDRLLAGHHIVGCRTWAGAGVVRPCDGELV